jgi:hypothetical protein
MKTKNLIIGTAIMLQMTIALVSLIAQDASAKTYTAENEKNIIKLAKLAPDFVKNNETLNLQAWMLNPNDWSEDDNTSWIEESVDPKINLEDWMLDPMVMANTTSLLDEESQDATIELQDWMLDPVKMSVKNEASTIDEEKNLEPWMLDPTKW